MAMDSRMIIIIDIGKVSPRSGEQVMGIGITPETVWGATLVI